MGENLRDWLADQLQDGKIEMVQCGPQPVHRARLQGLGFPQKDHKWVCLVVASGAIAMVSEDIDFYDPRQKSASGRVKNTIKQNQKGPVATYFRRKLKAPVMMLGHVQAQVH